LWQTHNKALAYSMVAADLNGDSSTIARKGV
jgi:hypothetical protein